MVNALRTDDVDIIDCPQRVDAQAKSAFEDVESAVWTPFVSHDRHAVSGRFFALSGSTLSYYDSEDISGAPRGVLDVASVHPLPSEPNGLLLHCKSNNQRRRDEKLICDTNVAYNAWFALLTRATTAGQSSSSASLQSLHTSSASMMDTSSSTNSAASSNNNATQHSPIAYRPNPIKMGYVHVRNVTLFEGRKYALTVGLNKGRKVVLCCDSMEEKTNWLLTLEGALKTAYSVIQVQQRRGGGAGLKRASSHIYDLDLAPEDQAAPAGVLLSGLEEVNKLQGVMEHSDDDGGDAAAAVAEDGSEASGVWI
ncbi:hypothetical protein DYB28_001105 [Aphanomyces astaci]|uniref:PH domain-containing protein n=1 Tax=Aphanomyces astaci TaxID=112090 RepID=A0A397AH47_APHAT|nr:hypothetical protein DYB36_006345 [Aphanomyces astaci]RHY07120.1 hypothetical protein DYB25_003581 [Aphanomyces astaci]RHY58881.1 hypothetical protein DYB30_002911 [Aphanomyces astaci]RHY63905.1 hypothetical protein DYB38_006984 [Aphanomyces astaci]RHY66079.1 hypothetical protein DYB34_009347 [Aphanomyces astaci]